MKRLNSLPWQLYPRLAISNANRPSPAPGTNICTCSEGLTVPNESLKSISIDYNSRIPSIWWEICFNLFNDGSVASRSLLFSILAPISDYLFECGLNFLHVAHGGVYLGFELSEKRMRVRDDTGENRQLTWPVSCFTFSNRVATSAVMSLMIS